MASFSGHLGRLALLSSAALLLAACGGRSGFLEDYQDAGGSGGSGGSGGAGGAGGATTGTTTSTTTSTGTTTPMPEAQIISMAGDSIYEGETSVVATPGGAVAAAWIAVSQQGEPFIAYAFSKDDGATWGAPVSIDSPDGRYGSDPVLAADVAGNIYLTWVGFKAPSGSPEDMQVYVARATPGSFFFGSPVVASDAAAPPQLLLDKPWITVSAKGSVLVSYASFDFDGPTGFSIIVARSADQGQSFTRSTVVSDDVAGTFYNLAYLCASQETGRVYATYLGLTQFGQQVEVKNEMSFSDDDGQSWPPDGKSVVSQGELDVAFSDPGCTALGGEVWATYGRTPDGNLGGEEEGESQKLYSIVVRHSSNGGVQFDGAMEAADPGAAPYFLHPDLKNEASGLLDVVYYAGAKDEDTGGSFRRARFEFGEDQPLSSVVHEPIVFTQSRSVPYWLGDYVGLYAGQKRLYTTFVANEGFESHVAFSAFDLP